MLPPASIQEAHATWEAITPEEYHVHRVRRVHYEGSIDGHQVVVAETSHGRTFYIDGRLQSSEADEWIYHEALVQPAMLCHPNPQTVLCIGGSTGGILREVLRTHGVKRLDFVNADSRLISITQQHLPHLDLGVFADARVRIIERDVADWLVQESVEWDLVIADPPDFPEWSTARSPFMDRTLIGLITTSLSKEGILALAAGAAHPHALEGFQRNYALLQAFFPRVVPYTAHIPCLGTPWGFLLADRGASEPSASELDSRIRARLASPLRFYDGEAHLAMRSVPRWLLERFAAARWPTSLLATTREVP